MSKPKPVWPPPKPDFTSDRLFKPEFDQWYETYIESLGPAKEVAGKQAYWMTREYMTDDFAEHVTHEAVLVGIRPIKEPTAEDILKQLVDGYYKGEEVSDFDLAIEKARDFLESKRT